MSSSTKGARHPAKPSAPEARTVDKEGLTLQLQSPHGRDTEQRHTLLLKSTLVASVILQQATAAMPMFSGCSQKDRVKAARNRLYHLQAEGGQRAVSQEVGALCLYQHYYYPSYRWPFQKTGDLEDKSQRKEKVPVGSPLMNTPLLTFGTYHLTAWFACFSPPPPVNLKCA